MTRTIRSNSSSESDKDLPRYFGKNGIPNQAPNKVKKDGHGAGNWGKLGDEIEDLELDGEFNFAHQRRRSNSSSGVNKSAKLAFENSIKE
jgi:hypothetical protein